MSWKTFLGETVNRLSVFEKEAPETFAGFATMAERAKRDGVLGKQTKEFIALGMAVSTRCDSCIGFHVRALTTLGTTREEMVDALSMITYMGGGPAMAYSAKALEAFDEFSA
ncbi:MAG: AhpD family alkylhydroperoxidase [Paracoccaceae bacterium]|jgi:AhpD family alkylhydroperoxidase